MKDPARRDFCLRTALGGAGLVLALSVPALASRARSAGRAAAPADLNAWLRIGTDDSITVLVDRSEMGQGVYTALPMLLAEELEVDLERIRLLAAPVGAAYVNVGNGGQITGTSNSVQDAWDKLRTAGAQARCMLIEAAARRWRVDPRECRAAHGRVTDARGRSSSYGELALAAASLPPPKDVQLKLAADFRLIGKPLPRLDTPSKVDGSAQFGLDVTLPGMLYAVIALSPTLGGKTLAVDAARAERLPGVRRVLSTSSGIVVVAEHFWQALKARDALQITWDPGPNSRLDNAACRASLERTGSTTQGLRAKMSRGDAAAALKGAAKALGAVYELPLLAHATMEPMNCTADVRADHCDVYVGTQVQDGTQAAAAQAAGLETERVDVHTTLLGGGFGRRLEVDFVPAAVEASKLLGAPVKLVWTREDDMTHDFFRPPAREALSAGFDANGRLTAFALHITSPSITARASPATVAADPFDSVIEYAQNFPYAVDDYALSFSRQEIGIDVGYLRSVSHAANCFAIECFIDELAASQSQDPLQFRLRLLEGKSRHRAVLEETARRANWGHPATGRFQGLAFMEGYNSVIAQAAELSLVEGAPQVHRITCVIDCGRMVNPRIVESQIESGIVFGLSAALWGGITLEQGRVRETNFHSYRIMRLNEMPQLDVHLMQSDAAPGGVGEAAVPPVAPAVCNALFAATGKRLRRLPIAAQIEIRA